MSFWTKMRRTMGGSDPRHWRIPGFLTMRLRRDHGRRALFALGIGLGIAGPLAAIMLAVAPPDQIGWAVRMSLLAVVAFGAVAFLYSDFGETIISLEEDGLRRKIKPFFVNLLGWRNRNEFWTYDAMGQCGVVSADRAGGKYAVLAIAVPDQTLTVIVPRHVDIKQVTAFLASQHVQVKAIPQIPPEARPQPSVGRRGMIVATVMAVAGVLLSLSGSVARLAIYREGGKVDSAAVAAAVKDAPEGVTVRECLGVGRGGVNQAQISPDGKWVWALTKDKRHLVWNDQQAEPAGELEIPSGYKNHAAFAPGGRRLVVVANMECHVCQLIPVQLERQFTLQRTPDHTTVTADGQQLLATTMSDVRLYDLETGQAGDSMPITIGPIVDTGLSADGNRLVVVQHSRILSVRLDNGTVDELVAYQAPHRAHLHGTLAAGGKWAAMTAKAGTVLYDLTAGRKASTIAAGSMSNVPAISPDGSRLAQATKDSVGVWDTKAKKVMARFTLNSSTRLDLSDDGRLLLGFSSRAPNLIVWQMPR